MTDDPTRLIKTEISMRIDGPHSRVEQFRQWFNKNFKDWAKTNDERRAFSPKLRTQNGDLTPTRPLLKSFSNQAGSARTAMAWIANPSGDAATRMIATAGSV